MADSKVLGEFNVSTENIEFISQDSDSFQKQEVVNTEKEKLQKEMKDNILQENKEEIKTPEDKDLEKVNEEEEKKETKKKVEKLEKEKEKEEEVVTEEEGEESYYNILAKDFLSKGIIQELPDTFKGDTEEEFINLIKENQEKSVAETIGGYFEGHPQGNLGVSLFNFIRNGGDINSFISNYSDPLAGINIKTAEGQKAAMRLNLKSTTKLTDDKIEAKIQRAEDSAILEEEGTEAYDNLKLIIKDRQEAFEASEAQRVALEQKEAEDTRNEILNFINTKESIKDLFEIKDVKTKKAFNDYLFKPTVKWGNTMVSQAFADDQEDNLENYLAVQFLRFSKYNTKEIKSTIKNKVTKDLADKLKNASKGKISGTGATHEDSEDLKTKKVGLSDDNLARILRGEPIL